MRAYKLSILLFLFTIVVANGQDQDIKIDAQYTATKCIEIEVKNMTSNKIFILFSQAPKEHSEINLTFIKNKKDTIDHYFVPLYDKSILRLPSQGVYKKRLCIWDGSKKYDGGKTVVDVDVYVDYGVYIPPSQGKKSIRKKFKFGEYKKPK